MDILQLRRNRAAVPARCRTAPGHHPPVSAQSCESEGGAADQEDIPKLLLVSESQARREEEGKESINTYIHTYIYIYIYINIHVY